MDVHGAHFRTGAQGENVCRAPVSDFDDGACYLHALWWEMIVPFSHSDKGGIQGSITQNLGRFYQTRKQNMQNSGV